jgi:uncharacterized protein YdaU (DUF1376 family)
MNYYERHIGDYLKKTIGLTMLEDGAYNRLMDYCYQSEHPLPLDKKEIYKLARAFKAAEKAAVDTVLEKFFTKNDEGFIQNRIQEELEKYWDRDADSETGRENAKVRQQRARNRRKALFDALRERGEVPRYNTPTRELQELLSRVTSSDDNAPVTPNVTRDDTATQYPLPTTHLPVNPVGPPRNSNEVGNDEQRDEAIPLRNVQIAVLLRSNGISTATSQHPTVCLDWAVNASVTDEILLAALKTAKDAKPNERIPVNYLKPIVDRLLNPPEAKSKPKDDWSWKRSDAGIERMGKERGMHPRPTESYKDYADRIEADILKERGKAA